jgi:phage replication O-like protein O
MASPQKENGYTPISNELFEAFYYCKLTEYERICVMHIWRKTYGWSKLEDWIANSQFSEETGIPKPHVTRTLKALREKNIVTSSGNKTRVEKDYSKWKVEWRKLPHQVTPVTSPGNKSLPDQVPTKTKKANIQKQSGETSSPRLKGKSNMSEYNPLGAEVIHEMISVDPKNKSYYGNKTQRAACDFLIEEYGLEEVKNRIKIVEKTNGEPYFPTVTTPVQLRDKWVQLEKAIIRHQKESGKNQVAF